MLSIWTRAWLKVLQKMVRHKGPKAKSNPGSNADSISTFQSRGFPTFAFEEVNHRRQEACCDIRTALAQALRGSHLAGLEGRTGLATGGSREVAVDRSQEESRYRKDLLYRALDSDSRSGS